MPAPASLNFDSLLQRVAEHVEFLPDKPEETADSTLRALWLTAAGTPTSAERALEEPLPDLSAEQHAALERLIGQRISGVPLAHLTGRQRFMGLEMMAGPAALVPRRETELLAQAAIDLALRAVAHRGSCLALDICTGSGNVALSIAQRVPEAIVFAADLSAEAIDLALQNAAHLRLDKRVEFRTGDLLSPFDSAHFLAQVDLLTCNPPYISSARVDHMPAEIANHEPRLAFDGGSLGVNLLMRLIGEAPRFVRSGGWLIFEVGLGQGSALVKRVSANPAYVEVATVEDEAGATRVVLARCR